MARLLIIDDEPKICRVLSLVLEERGHHVSITATGEHALGLAAREKFDLAIIDLNLPGMDGIEAFRALRGAQPTIDAVFITGSGTVASAVAAMRAGAFNYVTKPFDNDELVLTVEQALKTRRLGEEVQSLRDVLSARVAFPAVVGTSDVIQEMLRLMAKAARTDATILILGESGTGKELVARSLHQQSLRATAPFVAVNCSAIPAGLMESEFFGHERGSFTDAKELRVGRFEQAHRGTLFLDEVADLSLEGQAKLLRILEEAVVTRVGGRRPISIDVRIMAATNRDLKVAVAQGRFREDLFWRLHVIAVHIPPLRARRGDVPLLVNAIIDRLNIELGRSVRGLSAEAQDRLFSHDWPGNVRELENTLRRAMILAEQDVIQRSDLPEEFIRLGPSETFPETPSAHTLTLSEAVTRATSRLERSLIEAALSQARGHRGAAAQSLGINRKTLFLKMRAYRLTDESADEADVTH